MKLSFYLFLLPGFLQIVHRNQLWSFQFQHDVLPRDLKITKKHEVIVWAFPISNKRASNCINKSKSSSLASEDEPVTLDIVCFRAKHICLQVTGFFVVRCGVWLMSSGRNFWPAVTTPSNNFHDQYWMDLPSTCFECWDSNSAITSLCFSLIWAISSTYVSSIRFN